MKLQVYAQSGEKLGMFAENDLLSAYAGTAGVVARGSMLLGMDAPRPVISLYHAGLGRALQALDTTGMHDTAISHQILDFALIAECTGVRRPREMAVGLLQPLVPVRKEFLDPQRRSMALTALALRDTATALAFLDARPANYDEPRLEFEFNIYELIRYLSAALDKRWPADWIEPAWLEYLGLFPMHLAAEAADWPDLFMFARVLAELRGDRISDIADDLHARVQRLAQEAE
jgi:hypothetical protein